MSGRKWNDKINKKHEQYLCKLYDGMCYKIFLGENAGRNYKEVQK
jgi:hypothetical protein